MALITIEEPRRKLPAKGFALFELGFRPFFLAAALFAVLFMGVWLATLQGLLQAPAGLYPSAWHGHEMIFGYALAVIAGFLLTAVQNWTSLPMPKHGKLAALFALWLGGRLLPYVPGLPYAAIAAVDMVFLPVLVVTVARPVLKVKQVRNYVFPVLLLGMLTSNAMFHAGMLGQDPELALTGLNLALYLIVLIIVVMGGRVIPYFTERRVNSTTRKRPLIEWLAPITVVAVLAAWFVSTQSSIGNLLLVPLAGAAAIVHALRLAGWQDRRLWQVPLLWVLHLGYGWIAIGFGLDALAAANLISRFPAMHAYAAGAIGVLTLGMMSRVALGHTGRSLETAKTIPWAFGLINLAAAVRVLGPLLMPHSTAAMLQLGGVLWMAAFAVFATVYAPMLWHPRVDGKPG